MTKRKNSMTNLDIAVALNELRDVVRGSRVVNIYELDDNVFLLKLKSSIDLRLVLEPARRVHATSYDIREKQLPKPLVMALRKYLRDVRVKDIRQWDFERLVIIEFENGCKLYVELLPRGVLLLVDENNTILHSTEFKSLRDRVIRRGERYVPPPLHSKPITDLSVDEVINSASRLGESNIVRLLVRAFGLPPEVVEEVISRHGLDKSVSRQNAEGVLEGLIKLYKESVEGKKGYIVYDDKDLPLTVLPYRPYNLSIYNGAYYKEFDSFNQALDVYFTQLLTAQLVEKAIERYEAEKVRLEASLRQAKENLTRLDEKIKQLNELTQLISYNISVLYDVRECVLRVRETSGWDNVVGVCTNVVDVEPSKGIVKVNVGGKIIDYDVRIPPDKYIIELYRKIGELKKKKERVLEAIKELEDKIANLKLEMFKETYRVKAKVARREWYEKYHWMYTSNWFLVIGGRDASQNESIVKKFLSENNIFMHADIHGAPAVILFTQGKMPSEQDLKEAATIAACYSKAWKMGAGSIDVYWVWGNQVSKSPPSGEYIGKGAFMVYGKRNYIRGVELRLAIGLSVEDDSLVVIVGPDHLVRRRSTVYAVLVPGDEDPSRVAKRLKELFRSKVDDRIKPLVEALSVEDIRLRIPGRSRILAIQRGEAIEPPRPRKTS